ncbi:aldo/keto reductase [soil metagenome]
MRKRAVSGTPLELTEIGFGAASIGNLYSATSDEDADGAVRAAWESGIRYFDTAPHYGLGLSERRLGAALSGLPRDEYVISTKVGRLIVPREDPLEWDDDGFAVPGDLGRRWDFSREGILRSVEASLQRTGLDRFDILYLHDPDRSGIPDAASTGARTLIELRDQGVVAAVGIGSNDSRAVAQLFRTADIDVAMLAGRCSLLDHAEYDDVRDAAGNRSIVAAGIFNSGLLSRPRPVPGATFDYAPVSEEMLARAVRLADLAENHGATLPQAAIAYPLRTAGVANVTIGMRTQQHVRDNIDLYLAPPPSSLWDELFTEEGKTP